jgi:hypothetical protein
MAEKIFRAQTANILPGVELRDVTFDIAEDYFTTNLGPFSFGRNFIYQQGISVYNQFTQSYDRLGPDWAIDVTTYNSSGTILQTLTYDYYDSIRESVNVDALIKITKTNVEIDAPPGLGFINNKTNQLQTKITLRLVAGTNITQSSSIAAVGIRFYVQKPAAFKINKITFGTNNGRVFRMRVQPDARQPAVVNNTLRWNNSGDSANFLSSTPIMQTQLTSVWLIDAINIPSLYVESGYVDPGYFEEFTGNIEDDDLYTSLILDTRQSTSTSYSGSITILSNSDVMDPDYRFRGTQDGVFAILNATTNVTREFYNPGKYFSQGNIYFHSELAYVNCEIYGPVTISLPAASTVGVSYSRQELPAISRYSGIFQPFDIRLIELSDGTIIPSQESYRLQVVGNSARYITPIAGGYLITTVIGSSGGLPGLSLTVTPWFNAAVNDFTYFTYGDFGNRNARFYLSPTLLEGGRSNKFSNVFPLQSRDGGGNNAKSAVTGTYPLPYRYFQSGVMQSQLLLGSHIGTVNSAFANTSNAAQQILYYPENISTGNISVSVNAKTVGSGSVVAIYHMGMRVRVNGVFSSVLVPYTYTQLSAGYTITPYAPIEAAVSIARGSEIFFGPACLMSGPGSQTIVTTAYNVPNATTQTAEFNVFAYNFGTKSNIIKGGD